MSFGVWIFGLKCKIKYFQPLAGLINIYKLLSSFNLKSVSLCGSNSMLKGVYKTERCFILCNGPSVSKQNLLLLKNEIVFSVTNGYYHKDYLTIQPKFHCVPKLTYGKGFTIDKAVAWFNDMHKGIGGAELFLDIAEERLIRQKGLFPKRKIHYLHTGIVFPLKSNKLIDISGIVPSSQSVPIMCLMIAIYMGFKKIYLIGTEHDSGVTGEYKYFFGVKGRHEVDASISSEGRVKSLEADRHAIASLMVQYEIMKNIAQNQGINIYNSTLGGLLEVFPRVNLAEVLSTKT